MPKTNINKFAAFVIFALFASACSSFVRNGSAQADPSSLAPYEKPVSTGRLESPDLREASGLAASRCQNGVLWTHNDSGDEALLFAIDTKGKHLGVWKVANAENRDWEDIAAVKTGEKCQILIADIGNNELDRQNLTIYRIDEPTIDPSGSGSTKKEPLTTAPAASSIVSYPAERHNAEAFLLHPSSGEAYIVTKSREDVAHVYKFTPRFDGGEQTMTKVGVITVPAIPNGVITGGDIAPDGTRLVLCDYFAGYELTLPAGTSNFDEIWKQKPMRIDLGKREVGEAVAYSPDGMFVVAISEKKNTPVNIIQRK
ncbi:MAG TPA: hypothetical protein VFZ49_03850 [Pyrinomonadaceae bacterium]